MEERRCAHAGKSDMIGFERDIEFRQGHVPSTTKPVSLPYELRTEMTWIDFCHPLNPLGAPKEILSAMHTALVDGELSYAPDPAGHALRDALAQRFGISSDSFLVGTSPSELIRSAAQAFCPCRVGVVAPAPSEYALAVENAGHEHVDLINPVSFATVDAYTARTQAGDFEGVVLANPAYPSSRLLTRSTLVHYLETCNWVVVDESYIELSFGGESMVPLVADYPNLVVVRNPSVTYAMPGVPISYAVANPLTIKEIKRFHDGTGSTMFAEVLAKLIVGQHGYLEDTHDFLDKEIPWMQCMLSLIPGIGIHPAEGNFVLCEFSPAEGMRLGVTCAEELVVRLQLSGFLVRRLDDVPGLDSQNYFCVAVRTRQENQRLLDALRGIVSSAD